MAALQQSPDARPRSKSMLSMESIKSGKTHKSSGSKDKIDLTESPKDKRRLHSKADPTLAINEAQPSFVALEKSEIEALSRFQYRDHSGNVITDPDRSNPTRARMERPLDTIRSFEAAAERTRKGSSTTPTKADNEDSMNGGYSRRNSYFGVMNGPPPPSRGYQDGGYYGNRGGYGSRPDSYVDGYMSPGQPNPAARYRNNRGQSEPALYGGQPQQVYPSHAYQQSYDTVTSGEPWTTSTDPSSLNSSNDRIQDLQKPAQPGIPEDRVPTETYGFSGFGGKPQLDQFQTPAGHGPPSYGQPQFSGNNGSHQQGPPYGGTNGMNHGLRTSMGAPGVLQKDEGPRVPIKLNSPSGGNLERTETKESSPGKHKSWFKRRFSKD